MTSPALREPFTFLTYRYRLKNGSGSLRRCLRSQARAVNFVWNYCCEIDRKAASEWRAGRNVQRPTAYDIRKLCAGVSRELGLHSDTIDAVCAQFAISRRKSFPKTPRFRSRKRNLDWIPASHFRFGTKLTGQRLAFNGRSFPLWLSRRIPEGGSPRCFEFSADARGKWYANIKVRLPQAEARGGSAVGVDLGLKTLATLSTGEKVDMPSFYRKAEAKLALHQKRHQKARVRAVAAKVANQRRDYLHRVSTRIARENARIYIGDASPSRLIQTRMAKSVNDAGWAMLKHMLSYKAIALGGVCKVVSEAWTTRTCSDCGSIGGPEGIAGCGIRVWECADCGASHDRDVNAARNILRLGAECRPLAEGIST